MTYIYGCGLGVAIYERIESESFNPNVSLEIGYMLALEKPVCLLKEKTLKTLHSDLIGKLYQSFDVYKPSTSIPHALYKWLKDKGFQESAA
jgi:nucleoside 2-deoxyribosyltransferase